MMSLTRPMRPLSQLAIMLALFAGVGTGFTSTAAHANGDDWSLERKDSDPKLISQRMAKLRRRPFDKAQWSALRRALGSQALHKNIKRALKANPGNVALRVLDARADLAQGRAAEAAEKLRTLEASAGRWAKQVLGLRMVALEQAEAWQELITLLESTAETSSSPKRKVALLRKAYQHADRTSRAQDMLRLAKHLADLEPRSNSARLRLARAARAGAQPELADRAYEHAIAASKGSSRDELIAERAQARLDADNAAGASSLLWSLLEVDNRGRRSARARWWDMLAHAHRRDGSTDMFVKRVEGWVAKHPREAAAWRALAVAQESAGVDSVASWRSALKLSPSDPESATALIEAIEAKGQGRAAVEEYRRMLKAGHRDLQLGLDLAARVAAAGDTQLGLGLAAELEQRAGRRTQSLALLLEFYNLNGKPKKALEIARRMVKVAPRSADARVALGEQLYQMGKVPEALKQWAALPKLTRPTHRGWARHAELLAEHGRTSQAIESLRAALKLAPEQPNYLRLRAVLAEDQRRPLPALALWQEVRAVATGPKHKLLRDEARTRVIELLVGGSITNRRFRLEQATRLAQNILNKGAPADQALEAGLFLAELHTRREHYTTAVTVQHRLLALFPAVPERLEELATAQRRAGQIDSAMTTLEELLRLEPSRGPDVLAELSELAFEAGDEERALKTATKAAKRDRSQIEALVRLGQLHEGKGDTDAAARAYTRALETTPTDVGARLRLAELELTRGNKERSESLLHSILEASGPPELMRAAGRRALDLAEASDRLDELLAVAVRRTGLHPEADEPRSFLLATLDRVEVDTVGAWLDAGAPDSSRSQRQRALRAPLVTALTRGSIGARLHAAEHLGRLRLPGTAVPLATMATALAAPRDSTPTVRTAFERARLTALRAAATLGDADAVPLFIAMLESHNQTATRRAAAWGLARSKGPEIADALAHALNLNQDAQLTAIACLALSAQHHADVDGDTRARLGQLARDATGSTLRSACSFAVAVLTPDDQLDAVRGQLRSADPMLSAIAAWRLGAKVTLDQADMRALFGRLIGPGGLARDAASAAISRAVRRASGAPLKDADIPLPAPPRSESWSVVIERWLHDRVAPTPIAVDALDLAPHQQAISGALQDARKGTRAERAAADRLTANCGDGHASICLHPLVTGPVRVGN